LEHLKNITYYPFREFQKFVVILGGLVPLFVIGALAKIFGIEGLRISNVGIWLILGTGAIVTGLTIGLLMWEPDRHKHKGLFDLTFSFQAFFCFALIYTIIKFTGGSVNSVFSFMLLYIPSVIVYVYGKNGPNFLGALFFMVLTFVCNLFDSGITSNDTSQTVTSFEQGRFNSGNPIPIECIYAIIYFFQLTVLWRIAAQKEKLQNK